MNRGFRRRCPYVKPCVQSLTAGWERREDFFTRGSRRVTAQKRPLPSVTAMTLTESLATRTGISGFTDASAGADAWLPVCALSQLEPLWGEAVLLPGGAQAALFLLPDGRLFATDNFDPEAGAMVMSRGLVGTRTVDGAVRPTIASPLHKDVYDLETGRCYTSPKLTLPTLPVRVRAGVVELRKS